ncbi:MAG UNVERIFIED_CONTAM: hypothetical protein LVT10_14210 [Anaerolineae bacterium]
MLDALETVGILHQIRSTLAPVQIPKMPQVGLEMERVLSHCGTWGDLRLHLDHCGRQPLKRP